MAKGRFKDVEWNLANDQSGNIETWERVTIAVLMDLRDELKRLNSLLHCSNFVAIPQKLERIARNTRKKRTVRAVGKPKLRVVSR